MSLSPSVPRVGREVPAPRFVAAAAGGWQSGCHCAVGGGAGAKHRPGEASPARQPPAPALGSQPLALGQGVVGAAQRWRELLLAALQRVPPGTPAWPSWRSGHGAARGRSSRNVNSECRRCRAGDASPFRAPAVGKPRQHQALGHRSRVPPAGRGTASAAVPVPGRPAAVGSAAGGWSRSGFIGPAALAAPLLSHPCPRSVG